MLALRLTRLRRSVLARRFADEHRHVGTLDGAQEVDDPLGVGLGRADLGEIRAKEIRNDDAPAFEDLRPLERAREQLELRELDRLVDPLEDAVDICARLDELGRKAQGLRRRVRVLEPPGVRDERDVERLGDVRRQFDVELAEHVAQHLARRGCVGDDEIDLAEARVVVVVVDVDRKWNAPEHLRVGDPALVRAVHGEQDPLGHVVRPAALQARHRHEPILRRERRVADGAP